MRVKTGTIALLAGIMLAGKAEAYPCKLNAEKDTLDWNIQLDELVITSPKQRKELARLPVAASTVSGGMIKNKNIVDIKDISALVPNLFMPDYGSRLTSPVYIRGIGSKINAPSVGLYVDDMPYFEKSAFDFNINEVDKIEVLRGPQGTLYGRNTMGGLIKVYTRSPLAHEGTYVTVGTGSYLTSKAGISHYNKLTDQLGLALSANYNRSDGYFTNQYTGQKADKMQAVQSKVRLEWKKSEALRIGVNSLFDYTDQNGYPYGAYDVTTGTVADVNYNDAGIYRRTISTSGVSVNSRQQRFELNSQTTFQYLDDTQGIDQDFTPQSLYRAGQYQTQYMVSEELVLKSRRPSDVALQSDRDGGIRYNWLFGAFGFWQGVDNTVVLDYLQKQTTSEKFYDQSTYGAALFHQSEISNLGVKGLSLILGLRYDFECTRMKYAGHMKQAESGEVLSAYTSFDHDLKYTQFTPKISLQYEFASSGMLYATVSKGYKTGGFNTSFETEEQQTFDPEYSWNYEVGAKHPFLDKRVMAEVAFFLIDWRNQQITQPLPSGTGSMLTNAGHSMSKGCEVSIAYNIFNGLLFNTSYGYTYAKFKEYTNGSKDYSGKFLPLVPVHTFNAGVNYSFSPSWAWVDRVSLGLDYTGNGKIYWKEDNVASQGFYGLLNAKVGLDKGRFSVGLWARNLTSTDYIAFYFESGKSRWAQKGRPFMAGIDFQVKF